MGHWSTSTAVRLVGAAAAACLAVSLCGCGEKKVTLPARSATEQLLVSAAADRAIQNLPAAPVAGKKVFFDASSLETLDKAYVAAEWRGALARQGALLQTKMDDAEVVVEPRSGALSIDQRSFMIGLPELPLPVPFAGTINIPELPLFKMVSLTATAKFAAAVMEPKDGSCVFATGHQLGEARERSLWLLLVGPFVFTNAKARLRSPHRPGR